MRLISRTYLRHINCKIKVKAIRDERDQINLLFAYFKFLYPSILYVYL